MCFNSTSVFVLLTRTCYFHFSDGETFVSADDLRINLWNLEISNQSFNIVDVKPANMEDLTGMIVKKPMASNIMNLKKKKKVPVIFHLTRSSPALKFIKVPIKHLIKENCFVNPDFTIKCLYIF